MSPISNEDKLKQYFPALKDYLRTLHPEIAFNDSPPSPEELLVVTPESIANYFKLKVYGMEDPGENDHPILLRSNSLRYYERSVSAFLPRKAAMWDPTRRVGNPTKSEEVNNIIAIVAKKEVRKQGKTGKRVRPLEFSEFLEYSESKNDALITRCFSVQHCFNGKLLHAWNGTVLINSLQWIPELMLSWH